MFGDEFNKISQAYVAAKNFSADVAVYSYQQKSQKQGILIGRGLIRRADKNYFSRFKGDQLIANNRCAVIIDSASKEVTYFPEAKGNIRDPFSIEQIDTLLKKQDSVVDAGSQDGEEHYIFYNKTSVLIRIDMYVGLNDHFIKRLTYYYAPSTKKESYDMYKMEIYYNNIKLNKVDDSYFSEKKVIAYKGGEPYLVSSYNKYKLTVADKYQPPTQ